MASITQTKAPLISPHRPWQRLRAIFGNSDFFPLDDGSYTTAWEVVLCPNNDPMGNDLKRGEGKRVLLKSRNNGLYDMYVETAFFEEDSDDQQILIGRVTDVERELFALPIAEAALRAQAKLTLIRQEYEFFASDPSKYADHHSRFTGDFLGTTVASAQDSGVPTAP